MMQCVYSGVRKVTSPPVSVWGWTVKSTPCAYDIKLCVVIMVNSLQTECRKADMHIMLVCVCVCVLFYTNLIQTVCSYNGEQFTTECQKADMHVMLVCV